MRAQTRRASCGWLVGMVMLLVAGMAVAGEASRFEPLQAFAPFDYRYPVNRYRSSNGLPGPDYWQNRVDYQIEATLDPDQHRIDATVIIDYYNNSPDALNMLWLQLDQNRYRKDARGNFSRDKMPPDAAHTQGFEIRSVGIELKGKYRPAHHLVSDTRMRVDLSQPLAPGSGHVRLRIRYSYAIPGSFGGRTGWFHSHNGDVYEIAQWYPRLAVYDDLRGWNALPYLNNEFYLEYGDIDYRLTVPAAMIVVGSGELMNPEAVLSAAQRARLARARGSDDTVMIRSADEVTAAVAEPPAGTRTWHFHMHNTRDVAWAASAAFIWDAARIDLPDNDSALAMSVYPLESIKAEARQGTSQWQHSTQYIKHTVEFYSRMWFEYPWANAIAVGGKVGGMEYPGICFNWWKLSDPAVFMLATHEVGHNWFPMIVGFNERRSAWMDEGFNTFANVLASVDQGGIHAPKQDGEYAPDSGDPAKDILGLLADPEAPPILTRPDLIPEKYRHPVTYFKTAYGLVLLRDHILGRPRFHRAFRQFVRAWAFKHPSSSDFFRAMASAGGEDLDWFWRGWFARNWSFDMAITKAQRYDDDGGQGVAITVANLDKLVLPNTLEVTWADGSRSRSRIPVATWLQHRRFVVRVPGQGRALSATLDPKRELPDGNRSNDTVKLPQGG